MGNLGRAGYGATSDGLWPYTYDACDVGTLPNQTLNGLPVAATTTGNDPNYNNELSFLPGMRLSSCTCPGEAHPGPVYQNGSFVARSAPEIDIIEAQVNMTSLTGEASQSIQFAPFDASYSWNNQSQYLSINDPTISYLNTYQGGVLQQTGSVVSAINSSCYTGMTGGFAVYGFEYKPGLQDEGGFVTWINQNRQAWTFQPGGIGADPLTQISARPIPREPMYIIVNLGLSEGFSTISPGRLSLFVTRPTLTDS
jgi:beta-glucanase (GH16 family)